MISENLKKEFSETLRLYQRALANLEESLESCRAVPEREFSSNDKILVEALTGRFSRASDLLLQKLLVTIDRLELEERGSVIDRIHKAEKRGLVDSADDLKLVRELRNRIVHEYVVDEPHLFLNEIRTLGPVLRTAGERIKLYGIQRGFATESSV